MSFLSQKNAKKYEKMAKNGQKMAEIKNPFKVLLLTHFALYMPKIMGFGQKTKKRYHNCPTQQYMTGPFIFNNFMNTFFRELIWFGRPSIFKAD